MHLYQVDAFTSRLFAGNPAAVCPLDSWLPDETLQAIALENHLSETAYLVPEEGDASFHLRWFTPTTEVDLCGHATLASAFVVHEFLRPGATRIAFRSLSGPLTVEHTGGRFVLDFPTRSGTPIEPPAQLAEALGAAPIEVLDAPYTMAVFETESDVRALAPDMAALERHGKAVIATAPGSPASGADFVSRFFGPTYGVPEDPVTGSAHCTSTPYWAQRLGRSELFARQLSGRGGELWCEDRGARTRIGGHAVLYLEGDVRLG